MQRDVVIGVKVAFIPDLLNLQCYGGPSIKRRPGSVIQPQVGATNRLVPAFSLSKQLYPFCLMANHYYSSSPQLFIHSCTEVQEALEPIQLDKRMEQTLDRVIHICAQEPAHNKVTEFLKK